MFHKKLPLVVTLSPASEGNKVYFNRPDKPGSYDGGTASPAPQSPTKVRLASKSPCASRLSTPGSLTTLFSTRDREAAILSSARNRSWLCTQPRTSRLPSVAADAQTARLSGER